MTQKSKKYYTVRNIVRAMFRLVLVLAVYFALHLIASNVLLFICFSIALVCTALYMRNSQAAVQPFTGK